MGISSSRPGITIACHSSSQTDNMWKNDNILPLALLLLTACSKNSGSSGSPSPVTPPGYFQLSQPTFNGAKTPSPNSIIATSPSPRFPSPPPPHPPSPPPPPI